MERCGGPGGLPSSPGRSSHHHIELLEAVRRGDADVAIAAIAITPEREQLVDFTHPYFNSGLEIMVHAPKRQRPFRHNSAILWLALVKLLAGAALVIFLLANVLWLVERRRNPDFNGEYLPALGEALWGTMLIIATGEHGERNAPGAVQRIHGSRYVASRRSANRSTDSNGDLFADTVQRLRSSIRGPEDLPGKVIATVSGTVAADYLTKRGLPFVGVMNADDAIQRLLQSDVQAVVFAAPTLQYVVARRGHGVVQVVGPLFEPERIGIAVADGSPLRKRINSAMDQLFEDGVYEQLYTRWFTPAK